MYAELQADLAPATRLSEKTWGTEAALDHFLNILTAGTPATAEEIARAAASRRRRERDRARLRSLYMTPTEASPHPDKQIIARSELRVASSKIPPAAWSLITRLAAGFEYGELARTTGETPGNLRVQALRARKRAAA